MNKNFVYYLLHENSGASNSHTAMIMGSQAQAIINSRPYINVPSDGIRVLYPGQVSLQPSQDAGASFLNPNSIPQIIYSVNPPTNDTKVQGQEIKVEVVDSLSSISEQKEEAVTEHPDVPIVDRLQSDVYGLSSSYSLTSSYLHYPMSPSQKTKKVRRKKKKRPPKKSLAPRLRVGSYSQNGARRTSKQPQTSPRLSSDNDEGFVTRNSAPKLKKSALELKASVREMNQSSQSLLPDV